MSFQVKADIQENCLLAICERNQSLKERFFCRFYINLKRMRITARRVSHPLYLLINDIFLSNNDKNILTFIKWRAILNKETGGRKMKWTDQHSIRLTKWSIYVLGIIMVAAMIFMKQLLTFISIVPTIEEHQIWYFGVSLELCLAVGLVILFFLYCLIQNINNNETFTEENIHYLRRISWLCVVETVICLGSAWYYAPWLISAGIALFLGLIIRVIKNVFCQAYLIKEENDFTI